MGKRGNGEGSIYRRKDGLWCARVTVSSLQGQKRKAFYGKTRKEAAEKMAAFQGNPTQETSKILFADWLQTWLGMAKNTIAPSTYTRYQTAVRSYVSPDLGGVRLAKLTTAQMEDWRDGMLAKGLAPETVKHAIGVASTALGKAVSRGLISQNPASGVKRPKTPKKMRPLSEAQVGMLISAIRGTRYEALYRLAATMGLRHGEIHALHWSDLDEKRGTLRIERSVDTRGTPVWGRTKTGEERTVLLPTPVLECLIRHRAIQAKEKLKAQTWSDPKLMFPNQSGAVHRVTSTRVLYKKHLKAAGLPDIRFHDLRHTAATLMLSKGVDIATAAQILGHKDPAITLRRYSHVLTDMQRTAVERMSNYTF